MDQKLVINLQKSLDTYDDEFDKNSNEYHRLNFVKTFVSIYHQQIVDIEINHLKIFPFDYDEQLLNDSDNILLFEKPNLQKFDPITIKTYQFVLAQDIKFERDLQIFLLFNINQDFPKSPQSIQIRATIPFLIPMTTRLNRIFELYIEKYYKHNNFTFTLLFNLNKIVRNLTQIDDIGINNEDICKSIVDSISSGINTDVSSTDQMIKKFSSMKVKTPSDAIMVTVLDRQSSQSVLNDKILVDQLDSIQFFIRRKRDYKSIDIKLRCIDKKCLSYKYNRFEFYSIMYDRVSDEQLPDENKYGVVQIGFDFSKLYNQLADVYKLIHEEMNRILNSMTRLINKQFIQNMKNYDENLGRYHKFDFTWKILNPKTNVPTALTIMFIKDMPTIDNESFSLKQLHSLTNICVDGNDNHSILKKRIISKIIIELLKSMNYLHDNYMFYGHFNEEKIFITADGDIKLYDPFIDTLIPNFIPKMVQFVIEKFAMKSIGLNEDFDYTKRLPHLFKNDVFNFGSFILALNSDFQLLTIPPNIDQDIDYENEIRHKQYSKIENFLNDFQFRSMVHLLWLCMSSEENKQPKFSALCYDNYMQDCERDLYDNSKTIVNKVHNIVSHEEFDDEISCIRRLETEFNILECIGSGAFGLVFRALHKIDDTSYAIKLVQLSGTDNKEVIREVQLLSSLNHPNIVRYYSSWNEKLSKNFVKRFFESDLYDQEKDNDNDSVYLCIQMELCSRTLSDMLRHSNEMQNDRNLRLKILKQICEGLGYIHACSIIHRDLKTSNIFLDAKNNVKIGDFGLAKYDYVAVSNAKLSKSSNSSDRTSSVGTCCYMAPETRSKYKSEKKILDYKLDIFALGIIYFELCFSFSTFSEKYIELAGFQSQTPKISPKIISKIDPDDWSIIQRLTAYLPDQRPTTGEIVEIINVWLDTNENLITRNWPMLLDQLKSSDYRSLIAEVFSLDRPSFENINLISTNKWSKQSYHYKLMFTNYAQFIIQIHSHLFGAIQLSIPDLLPKHVLLDHSVPEHILIIDSNGTKMALPRDSRSSFGYFLALNQQINLLNRISVEKTLCKTPQSDYPYKHQFEMTFNSVFPNNTQSKVDEWIFPYVEMIGFICQNLVNFLPINKNSLTLEPYYELMEEKKLTRPIGNDFKLIIIATNINLFHTIYQALNLPVNIYEQILSFFVQTKTESKLTKKDFLSRLTSFKVINPKMAILLWDLHNISENTQTMFYRKISQVLLSYSNDDKSIQNLLEWTINLSIEHMQTIKFLSEDYIDIKYRQYFQFKFTLTHLYDSTLYFKGVIFYFVMNNNNEELLIATGGNFDPMINNMRLRLRIRNQKSSHVFGSSIKLDNLVKMMETCVASKSNTPFNNDLLYRKMFENLMKNISKNTSDGSRYSSADIIVLPYFILDKSDGNTDRDDNNGNDDKDDDGGNKRKFFEKINSKYREILKFILQLRSKSYRTIVIPESFCDPFNSNQSLIKSEHFQHIHTEATNQSIKLIVVVLKQPKSIKYQLHIITNNCSYTDENFQFIFTQSTDALKKIDTILDFDN